MKKILSVIISFTMLISLFPLSVFAVTYGDYEYKVTTAQGNKVATITAYNGNDQNVVIPSLLNGYETYAIQAFCSKKNKNIKSITIPDTVASITSYVFEKCTALESIEVEESNTEFSSENGILFNKDKTDLIYCPVLIKNEVIIPTSVVTICDHAFKLNQSITDLTIPASVIEIGSEAFYSCTNLVSINFSEGLKDIGDCAFENCNNLKSVKIPESIENIMYQAFKSCVSLVDINLPYKAFNIYCDAFKYTGYYNDESNWFDDLLYIGANLVSSIFNQDKYGEELSSQVPEKCVIMYGTINIAEEALSCCSTLKNLTVPDSVLNIGDFAFANCYNLEEVVLPSELTVIPAALFCDCESLKSIDIPKSVTTISDYAFASCHSLKTVNMPQSVTKLGVDAFRYCEALKNINISDNVTEIGECCFASCSSLTDIVLPASLSLWSHSCFNNCASLKSIKFPENFEKIPACTFSGCSSLESIIIPDSITFIGVSAFLNCSSLKNIKLPENDTLTICTNAFENCTAMEEITIPESVENILAYTFSGCTSLKQVSLPESIRIIYNRAFSRCTSLTNINIPNSVEEIGISAFEKCISLSSVKMSENIKTISNYAFANCVELKEILLPSSIENIREYALGYAKSNPLSDYGSYMKVSDFTVYGCEKNVAESYASENGFEFCIIAKNAPKFAYKTLEDGTAEITRYFGSESEINIPIQLDGRLVTSIGKNAFYKNETLSSINISEHIQSIADYAFFGCDSLESIVIPSSVTDIGTQALGYDQNGKIEGFTIYGYADSAAQEYAIENDINFVNIESICAHTETELRNCKEATCQSDGYTGDLYCAACGELLEKGEIIPRIYHTVVVDTAIAPTCTESGLTEGYHCSECGEIIIEQSIIPAKGHTEVIDEAIAPTRTETGLTEGSHCNECGEIIIAQEVIPACVLIGDINCDNKITILDAKWMLQVIAGTRTLTQEQMNAVIINDNGTLSLIDARRILKIVAGTYEE